MFRHMRGESTFKMTDSPNTNLSKTCMVFSSSISLVSVFFFFFFFFFRMPKDELVLHCLFFFISAGLIPRVLWYVLL